MHLRIVNGWLVLTGAAVLTPGLVGCGDGGAKSWSALSSCLAGPAAGAPILERVGKLRAAQLASSKDKAGWPGRCNVHAEALYAAAGSAPALKRTLQQRLGCSDEAGKCALSSESIVATATELWESAQAAGLKAEPAAGVAAPTLATPLIDAKGWLAVSEKAARVVAPRVAEDGSAVVVFAAKEGRGRLRACKLPAGFGSASCFDAHESVPELPGGSIDLSRDARGIFAAGLSTGGTFSLKNGAALTDTGLLAFNLETGEPSAVRGGKGNLVSEGIAIEAGTMLPPGPRQATMTTDLKIVPTLSTNGFVVVELQGGKASKELPLSIEPVGAPWALGDELAYVTGEGGERRLEVKALSKGRLSDVASLKAPFDGPFHSCSAEGKTALATFGSHKGQHGAKPTLGNDKTQVAITFRTAQGWSKAQQANLPFERTIDSELVCSKAAASVAWVKPAASGVEVGRLDCTPEACAPEVVKLPALESKWWWSVAPLGDKVLLVWRSDFGDTRFRLAPLGQLAQATDQVLFDSPDFGGPNPGEATAAASATAALLIFNEARPVLLRVGADGQARLLR